MSEQEQVKPDPFGEDMRYGVGLTLSEAEWLKGELELLAHETPQCHGIVNSIMPGINWAIETGRRDKERMVRRRPSVEDDARAAERDGQRRCDVYERTGVCDEGACSTACRGMLDAIADALRKEREGAR